MRTEAEVVAGVSQSYQAGGAARDASPSNLPLPGAVTRKHSLLLSPLMAGLAPATPLHAGLGGLFSL